jgi:hypothetical protein
VTTREANNLIYRMARLFGMYVGIAVTASALFFAVYETWVVLARISSAIFPQHIVLAGLIMFGLGGICLAARILGVKSFVIIRNSLIAVLAALAIIFVVRLFFEVPESRLVLAILVLFWASLLILTKKYRPIVSGIVSKAQRGFGSGRDANE